MSPDIAKALYERITSLDEFDSALQINLDIPDREQIIDQVGEALSDCTTHNRGRLFQAPSPWHAFFKLWEHVARARERKSAAFFRGHNVVGLSCVAASLWRDGLSEEAIRQARLAVEILAYMFEKNEILRWKEDDKYLLARTVAQHYGIRTSLLDVTLDPAVAIFFACMGGQSDAGAAFVFDWEHCEVMGLKVILPPVSPWARRLTIQRGFFLDFEEIRRLEIQDVPFEVQFPSMPGFEVRRNGKRYVPWPVDEPAAMGLISWVKNAAEHNQTVSRTVVAEIEARRTRGLMRHQFELMFGCPPELVELQRLADKDRGINTITEYLIGAATQLEVYLNHLCLQEGSLAGDRVLRLYETNRSVFDFYLDAICKMRKLGRSPFLLPQVDELLRIIGHEC